MISHTAADRYGRPAELGLLEISVTPPGPVDRELAARYAKAGVHRLILRLPSDADTPELERFVVDVGETHDRPGMNANSPGNLASRIPL